MDDYEEYAKTARMITKIHAVSWKEALKQSDTQDNNGSFSNDNENENNDEDQNEKTHFTTSKFRFHNNSNLDASMEEEKEFTKLKTLGKHSFCISSSERNRFPTDDSNSWKWVCVVTPSRLSRSFVTMTMDRAILAPRRGVALWVQLPPWLYSSRLLADC